jgi:hypothetical protein
MQVPSEYRLVEFVITLQYMNLKSFTHQSTVTYGNSHARTKPKMYCFDVYWVSVHTTFSHATGRFMYLAHCIPHTLQIRQSSLYFDKIHNVYSQILFSFIRIHYVKKLKSLICFSILPALRVLSLQCTGGNIYENYSESNLRWAVNKTSNEKKIYTKKKWLGNLGCQD